MLEYQFQVFSPGGNDTALVFGLNFDKETRETIDYDIRSHYEEVEQVGFIENKDGIFRLEMAGGEFCGNATRSATSYYLKNILGAIEICVSGVSHPLKSGVRHVDSAWASMPTGASLDIVSLSDEGFFLVPLEGIFHLVIPPDKSKSFLSSARMGDSFCEKLKVNAKELMEKYSLTNYPACGVMFLDETSEGLSMHPCVLVTGVKASMYYETACGSGSIAVALAYSFLSKRTTEVTIIQPSKYAIVATIEVADNKVISDAYIDGTVLTNGKVVTRRLGK